MAENVVQDARYINYTFDGKIILHMMTWYGVVWEMKNGCAVCIHLRCYYAMIIIATLLFLTLRSCGSSVTYIRSVIVKIVQYSSS